MPEQVKKTPCCTALLAHVDAGKTTLSEALLYRSGATRTLGRVDHRDAILSGVAGAKITAWWDHAVDVIPLSGGKGAGIQKILEHYKLDRTEAMAFGDGNNDIEMLTAVGTGIAMGNASPELKAVADHICDPVTEDGIYRYCLEKNLI